MQLVCQVRCWCICSQYQFSLCWSPRGCACLRESYPSLANQPSTWGAHRQLTCLPVKYAAGASAPSMNLAFAGLPTAVPVLGCSHLSESLTHRWLTSHPPGGHTCNLSVKYPAGASAPSTNLAFADLPAAVPVLGCSHLSESYPSLANQPSTWGEQRQLSCLPVKYAAGASAPSMNLAFSGLPVAVPVLGCSHLSESYLSLANQPSTWGSHRQLTCLPVKYAAGASAPSMNLAFAGLPATYLPVSYAASVSASSAA
ncbi:hypothetical protein P7K49_041040 [Saguinus oedipus]|uniref:Uncharacterized protein n=1 Tax=Saguinus oedipus TaxID=9490 RepID=A0ABQ9TBL8_SAGOE|nr:hypothetical protein P7K49_040384 [Saguinus oedipus]KAK2081607.1 hypothetical protein P7K49_041040 [Saguinus oedipus]